MTILFRNIRLKIKDKSTPNLINMNFVGKDCSLCITTKKISVNIDWLIDIDIEKCNLQLISL